MPRKKLLVCFAAADSQAGVQLSEKLARRGFECIGVDLEQPRDGAPQEAGLVLLLTKDSARLQALGDEIDAFVAAGRPAFVLRFPGADVDPGVASRVDKALRVNAAGSDPGEDLSRFANEILSRMDALPSLAAATAQGQARGGNSGALLPRISGAPRDLVSLWKEMDATGSDLRWSWEAFLLGPVWPVYRSLPVGGFVCLACLVASLVLASTVSPSPWAPLAGLAAGWMIVSAALGAYGLGLLRNHTYRLTAGDRAPEAWFKVVGTLAILVLAGFTAYLVSVAGKVVGQMPAAASPAGGPSIVQDNLDGREDGTVEPTNPLLIGDGGTSRAEAAIRERARAEALARMRKEAEAKAAVTRSSFAPGVAPAGSTGSAQPSSPVRFQTAPAARPAPAPASKQNGNSGSSDSKVLDEIFDPVAQDTGGKG